jgi:hypothetical protein
VTDNQHNPITWEEVRERARWNGLHLTEADARDVLPYHDQHRRWLKSLRRVLGDGEEPATEFSAAGSRDVRE